MILQEALLLGGIAHGVALAIGAVGISVVASLIGIRKALAADPNQVLAS